MDTKLINKKIEFIDRPIMEFANFINGYIYKEEFYEFLNDINLKPDKEIEEIYKIFDDNLSMFLKKEIEFFKKIKAINVLFFGFIYDNLKINTIEDYIDVLEKARYEEYFNYIGGAMLFDMLKDDNDGWKNVKDDMNSMKDYIKNIKDLDEEIKMEVLDLYDSKKETKDRIIYLIKKLKNIYVKLQDELLQKALSEKERYKNILKENEEDFIKKTLLSNMSEILDRSNTIYIYVSYTNLCGYNYKIYGDNVFINLSSSNIKIFKNKSYGDNLKKFLKLISDPTRFKILKIIAKEPSYTQELAKKLNITPATINYHLQNALVLGLVFINQVDNKTYYSLNKESAKEYIEILRNRLMLNE